MTILRPNNHTEIHPAELCDDGWRFRIRSPHCAMLVGPCETEALANETATSMAAMILQSWGAVLEHVRVGKYHLFTHVSNITEQGLTPFTVMEQDKNDAVIVGFATKSRQLLFSCANASQVEWVKQYGTALETAYQQRTAN